MGVTVLPLLGTDVASVEEGLDDGDVGVVDPGVCASGVALLLLTVLESPPVDDTDAGAVLTGV